MILYLQLEVKVILPCNAYIIGNYQNHWKVEVVLLTVGDCLRDDDNFNILDFNKCSNNDDEWKWKHSTLNDRLNREFMSCRGNDQNMNEWKTC